MVTRPAPGARFARVSALPRARRRSRSRCRGRGVRGGDTDSGPRSFGATAGAYVRLTKPRVIELLLVTTVPPMILAADGMPSVGLIVAVLVGGTLAAGGANTINCWVERDSDQVMHRTRHRPLPLGEIAPTTALVFAIALEIVAFALLWATANLLAASLAIARHVFYVFVYTIWLKPRSPQNIVIGGAAGAVPVLVGWAAVTGSLAAPAWVLFAVIFFWTPPHFWALSVKYRDDYAAAGIPMLPVVKGLKVAARQILVYSFVVVATTLVLIPVASMGAIYIVSAAVLGLRVHRAGHRARPRSHAGARDEAVHVLEPLPRAALRGHCRRRPRPRRLRRRPRHRHPAGQRRARWIVPTVLVAAIAIGVGAWISATSGDSSSTGATGRPPPPTTPDRSRRRPGSRRPEALPPTSTSRASAGPGR